MENKSHSNKRFLLAGSFLAIFVPLTNAATIQQGDVSSGLTGDIFIDEASTGGGDITIQEDAGRTAVGIRAFNFPTGEAGTITISGFGFATSAVTNANDATSIDIEFEYMGADGDNQDADPTDDVTIGVISNVAYTHVGAGEYFVNFGDEALSAQIDGLNNRFRIYVTVNDLDNGLQESIRFKTVAGVGNKLSVSGSFVPGGGGGETWAGYAIEGGVYVDTEELMGWIQLSPDSDWVWSFSLERYIFLPESSVVEVGAWAYVSR